jgi:hypothetical protein
VFLIGTWFSTGKGRGDWASPSEAAESLEGLGLTAKNHFLWTVFFGKWLCFKHEATGIVPGILKKGREHWTARCRLLRFLFNYVGLCFPRYLPCGGTVYWVRTSTSQLENTRDRKGGSGQSFALKIGILFGATADHQIIHHVERIPGGGT